ncbi:GNAT family N-acetyltransferase [Bacteroidales bacterium OttesenSCG-928-I21]|nr:GNAT family N-acetyltransferase [Bacteroidales bacterium OttesenSCG-928-I21]
MQLVKLKNDFDDLWKSAINVYDEAFPDCEKRPVEQHAKLLYDNLFYNFFIAIDDDKIVGIMIVWNLTEFVHLDYLAISPNYRNKGYGNKLLAQLQNMTTKPIVLEVEPPNDELTKRRVSFYEKSGFNIVDIDYFMPDYRNQKKTVTMRLMSNSADICAENSKKIIDEIHEKIYGIEKRK